MRVILAGQKSFGAAVYEMLKDEVSIRGVWAPVDFGQEDGKPDVKTDALARLAHRDDKLVYPSWRTPSHVEQMEVDLFVAAHSHDFISRAAREATRLGGIGYHPSLLPRHRGRDAVRWTIHMRDPIAGGSVYWLTDNVDGGPLANQDWCHVRPDDDASSLWKRELFPMGLRLIYDTLVDIAGRRIVEIPQDEACATWEPSWERPPLFKPDLTQIGPGINGFTHVTTRGGEAYRRPSESSA